MPPRSSSRASSRAARGPSFRTAEPAPLILLSGSDDYQASLAFARIREKRRAVGEVQLHRFDAANYQPGELLLAVSPSLFGDGALVEFHGLEKMNEAALKDLTAYVAHPDPEAVVVLHHGGGNRGKPLLDAVKKTAPIIDCSPLKKDAERVAFVQEEFKAARRRITPDVAQAIVTAVGQDLAEIGSSVNQLLSDLDGEITAQVVGEYFGHRVEATGFAVADATVAGQGARALSLLRGALATGTDPIPILAALTMKIRQAAQVAGAGMGTGELASTLKLAPWQVQQAQDVARRVHPQTLASCVRLLAETDAALKGESRDPRYALERAVVRVSRAMARR